MSEVVFEVNTSKLKKRIVVSSVLGGLAVIFLLTYLGLTVSSILALFVGVLVWGRIIWRFSQQLRNRELIILNRKSLFDRSYGLGFIPWSNIRAARFHELDRMNQKYQMIELVLKDDEEFFKASTADRRKIRMGMKDGITGIRLNTWQVNSSAEEILDAIRKHIELYSDE